jgi:predicted AlkP superfamily pyrophosphatase or phosphodiesterase
MVAILGLWISLGISAEAAPWATTKPKLVVVIVIDQFRADYISRYQHLFGKNGFMALINGGAYFPYGEYDLLEAMTGPGHATILTGAYPYQMGIPTNDWYDRKSGAVVYCVEDVDTKTVGTVTPQPGSSPKNLVGTTVGDELKNADWPTKSISIALKDRAAILLGGHRADLALWYDKHESKWISSTYYRKDGKLPEWVNQLNGDQKAAAKCDWAEPCGLDSTVAAVKAALNGEKLGQGKSNDILSLSFSAFDVAGHHFGPNSDNMRAMTVAQDKAIAEIRAAVQAQVPGGLKNVLFVLTGDHGVASKPEYLLANGIDAGRLNDGIMLKDLNDQLTKKFGAPSKRAWINHTIDFNFFIDEENVRAAKIDMRRVENEVKEILIKNPAFAHVFTHGEYEAHLLPPGMFARKIEKTYYVGRSGDVIAIPKPFYINDAKNDANHLTGYTYDRTVPIVFSGFGIKNGLFAGHTEVVDIAPTLSFVMGVLPPALCEGRVLTEALK